jgi:glycosyltransferase
VEIVITLDRTGRERVGPVPDTVRFHESVPVKELLETCDLVVHHGGGGTTISALTVGIPHLLLP